MSVGSIVQSEGLLFWDNGNLQNVVVLKTVDNIDYFEYWNDGAVGGTFYPITGSTSTNFMMFMPL